MRDPPQPNPESVLIVKARTAFNWRTYLIGRAVGVLPVFWLSLIIAAPRWQVTDNTNIKSGAYTRVQSDECIALYVIAMESWVRPQCEVLGVNTSLYGSIIFNVFIMYCVFRVYFRKLQDKVMSLRTQFIDKEKKSLWNQVGYVATMLAFNRPCKSVAIGLTITLLIFMSGILILYNFILPWKNAVTYFPFFLLGLSAANLVECIQWALWNPHTSLDSWAESDLFPSSRTTNPGSLLPFLNTPSLIRVALLWRHSDSSLNIFLSLLWRFSPDLIAILCGLLMSTDGPYGHRVAGLNTFWGVPCIVVAFMVISTLQRGVARKNLSRMILESPPLNLLGYISYPTCKYLDCTNIY